QKLWVIASSNDNDIIWKIVELKQQRANDTLYLPRFMSVTSLFAQCFELVKEQHAAPCSSVVKQGFQADRSFAQVAANQRLIAHNDQRHHQLKCQRFSNRCFTVPWRPS